MCPVCIAEDISGELRPVLLSRSQFISHWKSYLENDEENSL
jgi:hypothetical protein